VIAEAVHVWLYFFVGRFSSLHSRLAVKFTFNQRNVYVRESENQSWVNADLTRVMLKPSEI